MRRAAAALAVTLAIALAGCSSSGSDHSGAEQACKLLDSYYVSRGTDGDINQHDLDQAQAMADAAAHNSYDDLTEKFNQLLIEAKSDQGEVFNIDYASDLDYARLACIRHGYVVRAPAS